MKNKLTDNLGLKILAVLFSTVLWLIAININDPISQDSYSVNVQLQNTSSLTSAGKYIEVLDGSDRIRVTVRGSRTVLSALSDDNIVATADVTKMNEDGTIPIELNTTRTSDKIEGLKSDKEFVKVNVENISKHQLPIDVKIQNEPAEGYILGATTTSQNVVIVSGPESVINQIGYAGVEINVADASSDVKISLPIHLYDEEDNIIDSSKITMSMSEVSATATILQTKTVPVEVLVTGNILDGYVMTGQIDCSPAYVTVAGKSATLKNLGSLKLTDAVDITGYDKNVTASIDMREYLPDGVTIVEGVSSYVTDVVVYIEKTAERSIEVSMNRVHTTDVPEGYTATIVGNDESMSILVEGLRTTLSSINEDEIVGIVSVEQFINNSGEPIHPGINHMPVKFTIPGGVKVNKEYKVDVMIKKIE